MDFILIGIGILIVILQIANLLKKDDDKDIVERLGKLEKNVNSDLGQFKFDINKNLNDDFNKLNNSLEDKFINMNEKIENKLLLINEKVNERIDQNFEKTNKTFNNILERISKIDEAQKKIDSLTSEIVDLQSVLTDKKTRGIFGEVNLNYILSSVFGDKKGDIYDIQHTMSNGSIADSILFAPEPLGTICIDSKFPLENYQRMTDRSLSATEREVASKMFKADVKKHIDAISSKYIIAGETADEAVMFLPAEAIFAEINAYHYDLLEYAYNKKVWIAGPTTLMSTLTIIQMIVKNMEKDKYAKVIHVELNKLSNEFAKYRERWDKLSRSIDTVTKDIKDINITTEKITKRFDSINSVDVNLLTSKEDD